MNQLNIVKHEHTLVFKDGKSQDLEIAGYGFISFKPCIKTQRNFEKKITFYLPEKISFRFRDTISKSDSIFHNKTAFKKNINFIEYKNNQMH